MELSKRFQGIKDLTWLLHRPGLFLEWHKAWGTFPVISWLRAADLFLGKNFELAAKEYERGLKANRNHPARDCALVDLGYCLYRNGHLEKCLKTLSFVTQGSVAMRDAYLLQGKVLDILGRADKAMQSLLDGLEIFPDDMKILVTYFHYALFNGLNDSRLPAFKDRLAAQKQDIVLDDDRRVIIDAALAHYEICYGDSENGDRMLARALATGRAPYDAVILRGERLLSQGRVLQAREQLNRAVRIASRNPRPLKLLAESYFYFEDFIELDWAEQLATQACKLSNWKNFENTELLTKICEAKGDQLRVELFQEMTLRLQQRYLSQGRNLGDGQKLVHSQQRVRT